MLELESASEQGRSSQLVQGNSGTKSGDPIE